MPLIYIGTTSSQDYLAHHGILGQKWGVRRFQNPDGSLTAEGRERYSSAREQKDFTDKLAKAKYSDMRSYMQVVKTPQMKSVVSAVKGAIKRCDADTNAFHKKENEFYKSKDYERYAIKAATNEFDEGVRNGWWDNSKESLDHIIWAYLNDDMDQGYSLILYREDNPKFDNELRELEQKMHDSYNRAVDASKAYVKEFLGEYGEQYVGKAADIARIEASPESQRRQRQYLADMNKRPAWY